MASERTASPPSADRDDASPTNARAIVRFEDAAVRLGHRTIWSDVNLSVAPGEFVAVLGPNGVGKSTLIKAALGLVPLAAGSAFVLGRAPGHAGRDIGYLPQRRSFDRGMRVRGVDVVRLGADGDRWGIPMPPGVSRAQRRARARVDEVIDLVGATAYARRPIGEVSGGEQQRLLIAQALVRRPQLLLLDEPLDSLDLPNQAAIAALVQQVCRDEHVTVIIVAHDVNPILPYLDRVVYIAQGGAVSGRVSEVITSETLERAVRHSDRSPARLRRPARRRRRTGSARVPLRPPHRPSLPLNASAMIGTGLSWNLRSDLHQLFAFHFMVNAFRAGTIVAVLAGAIGWFMVLRRQAFAGHTLAVVSFPGAAAAIWLGFSATAGYFAACIACALVIAAVPPASSGRTHTDESAVTGTAQAFALACGVLFVSLYGGFLNSITGLLFGTFLGISDRQVVTLLIVAAAALVALGALARPLFFATVDSDVAHARGVPVRFLGVVFLVLMGCAAAEVSQITGALLVFALLVMPAATAQQLTARPVLGFVITISLAILITWTGLAVAFFSVYPVGFFVTTFGMVCFVLAVAGKHLAARAGRRERRRAVFA